MIAVVLGLSLLAPVSPRERIRFDADWRFLRGEEHSRNAQGPTGWRFKPANVTGLDVPLPDDLASGDWKPVQPGDYILQAEQYGWFRADLGSDPEGAEKVLTFESVDEDATVFLNGKRIGKHIGFGTEFTAPVREAWRAGGPNTLVVLVYNGSGLGGINGGVVFARPEADLKIPEMDRGFDDAAWRKVHLPHDYVVEGTFDPKGDTGHGSLPKPLGYYRKSFVPPDSMRGKSVWIDFDGVYRNATFYLNGKRLGQHPSGYIGVRYDLTGLLEFGKPNVLSVTTDPRRNEGWWYEGGGIYRHVWLNAANPVHVAPDGIFARSAVEGSTTKVRITTTLASVQTATGTRVGVRSRLLDPKGKPVGTLEAMDVAVGPAGANVDGTLDVKDPQLWDLGKPNLYRVETTVLVDGKPVDVQTASFGIRTIEWNKDRGFLLNGREVKLKGTCNHQDHAGVGVALPDGLMEWRIQQLLKMGSNAYRTSHNPVAPEFLDACDRLGMLVLDETRHLGDTSSSKSGSGTKADDLSELKAMVRRDRNHPSIVAWSLYNEEGLQGTEEGAEIFKKMRAVADDLDGTRLSTGASNFGYDRGIVDVTDLFGFNYNIGAYESVRRRLPNTRLFGSETASAVSTRGIYENDPVRGYVSAYDVNRPSWGATAEQAWKAVDKPWMAGAFVWTGFDYKGEPTPYGWPCINSHFGILDIAGFPKDTYYYYRSWWSDQPVVHVLPHWNWDGGTKRVWVHSNAEEVDLVLNGKSLGRKAMPRLGHLEWDVPYTPGTLEAVGYRDGKAIARDRVETTGAPATLRLKTDRTKILADGEDLTVVAVEVLDAQGRVVPTASNRVAFAVEGAGTVGGVGNGDPSDHDPDQATYRKAFNGLCMVLVKSNGTPGRITLRATSPGLKDATLSMSATGGVVSR